MPFAVFESLALNEGVHCRKAFVRNKNSEATIKGRFDATACTIVKVIKLVSMLSLPLNKKIYNNGMILVINARILLSDDFWIA